MADQRNPRISVRQVLRRVGGELLSHLETSDAARRGFARISAGLRELLTYQLSTPEQIKKFWDGIKPAMKGCPDLHHFDVYENIAAYGFVHVLDRYLRVWEVMRELLRHNVLPIPVRDGGVLDIGSGPATALYAAADFYEELNSFARQRRIERLMHDTPSLFPIELSPLMCSFFHCLSESMGRPGPFGPVLMDFAGFEPNGKRAAMRQQERDSFYYSEFATSWNHTAEIDDWINAQYRFQLVFFSNFITIPDMTKRFERQISDVFQNQLPGGIVVVLGGTNDAYPRIYGVLDALASNTGHRRIAGIKSQFDDSFRSPYFSDMKRFNSAIWNHIASLVDVGKLPRTGMPPYWDDSASITRLKPFAARVYRKGT